LEKLFKLCSWKLIIVQKRENKMRYDYGLYLIAIICFVSAGFLFMGYTGYVQLTTGNEVMDLVVAMFSAVLGVVFIGIGYGVRPKKAVLTQPPLPETSAKPKTRQAKSEKKPRKKAVRKRRPKKKT
jgi:hypothetical protein